LLDIIDPSKPFFDTFSRQDRNISFVPHTLSWTCNSAREPSDKTAYMFSPAELGMLAPDERLTFSTQKNFTDCKHTHMEYTNKTRRPIISLVCAWLGIHKLSH